MERVTPLPPSSGSAPDPWVGRLLSGRYRLVELVGRGGMGAVYAGEHVHLRKRVAVKILLPEAAADAQLVARFEREAIAGAHVSHPGVVVATDFGKEPDGLQFLVLEFVRGPTLAEEIRRGPLPARRAVSIARQLACALEAIHAQDIVHRDLKPQNVILSSADGSAKLVDFGFAKVRVDRLSTVDAHDPLVFAHRDLTLVGTVFGTVAYMPPETAYGMDRLDGRADLYALGVTLYEMLAGVPPFSGATPVELFSAITTQPPPPIAELAPQVVVPPAIEAVVRTLLAKEPGERYQSATELLAALDAAVEAAWPDAPPSAAPAASLPAREVPPPALAPDRGFDVGRLFEPLARLGRSAWERGGHLLGRVVPAEGPVAEGLRKVEGVLASRRGRLLALTPVAGLLVGAVVWASVGGKEEPGEEVAVASSEPPEVAEGAPGKDEVATVDGVDAQGWVRRLAESAASKVYGRGADAIVALAELDPDQFKNARVRADAIAVAVGIAFARNEQADRVFSVLEKELGTDGLEMLYEIVRTKAGTVAYGRAVAVLGDPAVAARATPALRVAFELRRSTCDGKRQLFERAAAEGDARVLTELKALKYAPCASKSDPCCFRNDAALGAAIEQLAQRLE